ncbi:MAG TPA: gliding motility-associated C-terminal domain-containing protein, partial [Bacteroidales bacterium]|nr:gliding motility-associated C-terminal domain-containing protein [Bacteroidales bacterium]
AIMLQSPSIFTTGQVSFDYSVTSPASVTGYATPVTGTANNHIITDMLVNHSDAYQVVTYRITPKSPVGCKDGPSKDITVTVNPTPRVIPVNPNLKPDTSICYGTNTHLVLTSPTVMTSGSVVFDYTVGVSGGPGVISGSTAPGSDLSQGYTIDNNYQNNSDTIQSVYYTIIPKVDNNICTPGNNVISEVKVHAEPLQNILNPVRLTCVSGTGLASLEAVISKGADPYHIVWDGPLNFHMEDVTEVSDLSSGKYIVEVTDNLACSTRDSITIVPITAHAYISATVIPPGNYNISCIGSTDGRILVSVTGGITPPYQYTVVKNDTQVLYSGIFTNNLNLADPTTYHYYTGLGAGTYTLIITDINGCQNTSKVTFRVPPPVVADYGKSSYTGGYNISCKGYNDGSVWIESISGGRGGYSYRWYTYNGNITGPDNTDRLDNITAGTYYLEVTDVLGCVTIDSVKLTEPEGMVLTGSQVSLSPDENYNISCNGANDGSISISVSGGSGNYSYYWTGPGGYSATTEDISDLSAGTYNCTTTDVNGCVLTPAPEFTLTEPAPLSLTVTPSVSVDGAYNISCFGATGSISVNVTGGSTGNYNFNWSTTDGSGLVEGQANQPSLTAGSYHLDVTDLNGCIASADVTLTQPPELITGITVTDITCQASNFDNGSLDLSVSGGTGSYSYLWSNGATTQDISGLTAGKYSVTITYNNVCIVHDSATVNLPPPLQYTNTISDYNGFNISCNGQSNGSIQVNVTSGEAPYYFTWTGPDGYTATTKDISGLKAGDYHILITDSNSCTAEETITLTEPGLLGMTIDLSSSTAGEYNINCAGDRTGSIHVNPENQVGSVEYLWDDGVFGDIRTNLAAGDYRIIIIDQNNCQTGSLVKLTEPDSLKMTFDITRPWCPDKPDGEIRLNVTGGVKGTDYIYRWSDGSADSYLSGIPEGLYRVIVEDMNECIARDSVWVYPENQACLVIPNAISPNGDLINDVWNIGMKDLYPDMEVKIFNRWGELVWNSEKGYPRPWDGTSRGEKLPIDSYHYIIDLHNGDRPLIGTITIVK